MNKIQTVIKNGVLSVFATAVISLFGLSQADAASYTYTVIGYSGLTGTITTSCDNCVLNAGNITAWSMAVPGGFSIASTVPGAQVSVPAGDTDLAADAENINFVFSGSYGDIVFSNPGVTLSYGAGSFVEECSNSGCSSLHDGTGVPWIASVSVPFVGSEVYSFTGNVTTATGIYATAGTTVSGTFTFDPDAGDGALPVSLTTPWSSSSTGTSQLVASTLKSGSVTFSDAGSTSNKTTVAGLASTGSSAPNEYYASDTEFSSATKSVQHSFQIVGGTGTKAPFNSNGLPVLKNGTGTGTLLATVNSATVGQLSYTITSLAAAPTTLSISPSPNLVFPNTLINTKSAPLPVTITNTSPNDVSFIDIGIYGLFTANNFQIAANSCPTILHSKASCTVSIVFFPYEVEGSDAALSLADDALGSPQQIYLQGQATPVPAPYPTLTSTAVTFSGQQVGTTSAEQFITLKNTGNAPLTIFSITLAPPTPNARDEFQPDAFALRNACVATLAPGRACTVFVRFSPVAAGPASASLVIADNVLTGYPGQFAQSISLSGTGTTVPVPSLAFNVPSLTFASQVTGTASAKQAFDLTNTGTAPLNISSIALAGPQASNFTLQNACASVLPAGQHCAVFVTFKPATAGELSAAVLVTGNAGGVVSFPLYGTATPATAPVLKLSAPVLFFDSTPYRTQSVNLTNTGTAPLTLSSIAIVGDMGYQSYFTLRNDCVAVLAPGRLCTLFVDFNPMAARSETGRIDVNLVINDNEQVLQRTVLLEAVVPCALASGC